MSSATPPCANLSGASRSPFRALAISDRHQNGTLIAITTECRSGSKRNSDRHHPGTLIGIVRNPQLTYFPSGLQTLDQKRPHLPVYFSTTYVVLSCPKLPSFCSLW